MAKANPLTQWNEKDASALRSFLDTCPHFLPHLATHAPKITATQTTEARAMSGSEVKGAQTLLEAIATMAQGEAKPQTADDAAFVHGQ